MLNLKHRKQKENIVYVAMENSVASLSTRPLLFGRIYLEDKMVLGYKTLISNSKLQTKNVYNNLEKDLFRDFCRPSIES